MENEKPKKKKGGCLKIGLLVLLAVIVVAALAGFIWFKAHEDEYREYTESVNKSTLVGQEMPDFEVTTTSGETVSLDSLLEDKEVAVVVLFATWCGPCEREFPEMDKVYQKYQDKMGMIAVDIDILDSEQDVKSYADSHGLSFPIAYSKGNLAGIETPAYPTTLVVDRNGKIGMHRIGSIPDEETFEKIVTTFMGDNYEEKQIGYYTFYAYADKENIPGVEFTVTSEEGTETYFTGEDGSCDVFTDKPQDLTVKVISVPEGYTIDGTGEIQSGIGSTTVSLPVTK